MERRVRWIGTQNLIDSGVRFRDRALAATNNQAAQALKFVLSIDNAFS